MGRCSCRACPALQPPSSSGSGRDTVSLKHVLLNSSLTDARTSPALQQYITKAMELQGERLIEASRVHARPFSGGDGATGTGMGMGTGVGMAQSGGHTGEMHQGAGAAGGMPGARLSMLWRCWSPLCTTSYTSTVACSGKVIAMTCDDE